jgi:hypothetical protein
VTGWCVVLVTQAALAQITIGHPVCVFFLILTCRMHLQESVINYGMARKNMVFIEIKAN